MNVNDLVFSPEETDEEELMHMSELLIAAGERLLYASSELDEEKTYSTYVSMQFQAYRIVEAVFKALEYRLDGFAHDVPPAYELFEAGGNDGR